MYGYGLHNVKRGVRKLATSLLRATLARARQGHSNPHTRRPVYRYTFARTRSATGSLPDAWCAAPRECHKFSFLSAVLPQLRGRPSRRRFV
jgi:hypothetical protein